MYIWNINKLVKALQEGTITNKQKKRYRIFFWIIFTLSVLAYPVVYIFSLTIPLFLHTFVWSIPLFIIAYTYIELFAPYHSMDETNLIDIIMFTIIGIAINIMNIHYFKKIFN